MYKSPLFRSIFANLISENFPYFELCDNLCKTSVFYQSISLTDCVFRAGLYKPLPDSSDDSKGMMYDDFGHLCCVVSCRRML